MKAVKPSLMYYSLHLRDAKTWPWKLCEAPDVVPWKNLNKPLIYLFLVDSKVTNAGGHTAGQSLLVSH